MSSAKSPDAEAMESSINSTASTPTSGNVTLKVGDAKDSGSPSEITAPEPTPSKPECIPHPQQQYVDHSYTDYAKVDEDDLRLMKQAGAVGNTPGASIDGILKHKGSSVMMPFPGKLLEVLDRGDLTSIIDWMPHCRAFIVKQPKVFTAQVLPRYFKQTKFLSFTRQLNLWGFKRITRGLDAGAYYHELFLPGRPNLVMRMKRQKIKGTGIRPIPNPDQEPNFYYEYPHVAKVPRSSVPIPLPPLPSERIASLMGTHTPISHQQQPSLSVLNQGFTQTSSIQHLEGLANLACNLGSNQSSLSVNRSMGGTSMGLSSNDPFSLAPSQNTLSSAAAAEHRLQEFSRLNSFQSESLGLPSRLPSARPSAFEPAPGALNSTSDQFIRRASMSSAPRNFAPVNDYDDEVSNANRRLMERLLGQTTSAPAPQDMFRRHMATENATASLLRRPSCQTNYQNLLNGAGTESSNPDAVRRESFQQSPTSLFPKDFGGYMHHGSRASSMPSSMPSTVGTGLSASRHQDVSVATLTNALRDAQRFEDMARSQRDSARALAVALQQRMGGQDMTLPLGRGDFNFDDIRSDQM